MLTANILTHCKHATLHNLCYVTGNPYFIFTNMSTPTLYNKYSTTLFPNQFILKISSHRSAVSAKLCSTHTKVINGISWNICLDMFGQVITN